MFEEKSFKHLAEIVVESIEKERLEIEDPFELYANRLKERLYGDADQLSLHCLKGYRTLLNRIQSE